LANHEFWLYFAIFRNWTEGNMIRIDFAETDIEALHYERTHHPNHRVRRRMEAVYLESIGPVPQRDRSHCARQPEDAT
jgi:hypothetical protein